MENSKMSTLILHFRSSIRIEFLVLLSLLPFLACDSMLDIEPQASLNRGILANEEGVNGQLVGTYAALVGNVAGGRWYAADDNWIWGSVAADEAYKGSSPGDQGEITSVERFEIQPNSNGLWSFWKARYEGVARANETLRLVAEAADMSAAAKTQVEAEARFLRGHFHFELRRVFNKVPYITEDLEDVRIPNTTEIWSQLESDMAFASEHLTLHQETVGRATRWAAKAYLAKVHLYQQDFAAAKPLFDEIVTGGPYQLAECYHDNFNAETNNNSEAIFQVQHSVNDGRAGRDIGRPGSVLNFPYTWGPGRCCGFFQPSQNLVNAFKVDPATGLPVIDRYNDSDFKNDQGILSSEPFTPDTVTPVDPRLDWTVGRRGVPYLDWGEHPGHTAIRAQAYGGPYSPIKNSYYERQEGMLSSSTGIPMNSAINYSIIRYADVLLMAAEVEAEIGSLAQATQYVNAVRARARDGCWVRHEGGTPAANYHVGLYSGFSGRTEAIEAIRFERRLELGMEGHRFFDLVRWGTAVEVMNEYLQTESEKRSYLSGALMMPSNTYFPIPDVEIQRSAIDGVPVLVQNDGY